MREYIVQYERKEADNPKDKCDLCNHAIVGEVVCCKDCRWWNSETKGCKRNPSVEAWQEDDFCNHGKRWSNAID